MTISLIYAQSGNGFIGKEGKLLFSIEEDMKRFKMLTINSVVIMGRKTWEDIPSKFRPLPGRENYVVTSSEDYDAFRGATVVRSLDDVLLSKDNFKGRDVFLIGGERIYSEGLIYADKIYQTYVTRSMEGDAKAPVIDKKHWNRQSTTAFKLSPDGLFYQFNVYVRNYHGKHDQNQRLKGIYDERPKGVQSRNQDQGGTCQDSKETRTCKEGREGDCGGCPGSRREEGTEFR